MRHSGHERINAFEKFAQVKRVALLEFVARGPPRPRKLWTLAYFCKRLLFTSTTSKTRAVLSPLGQDSPRDSVDIWKYIQCDRKCGLVGSIDWVQIGRREPRLTAENMRFPCTFLLPLPPPFDFGPEWKTWTVREEARLWRLQDEERHWGRLNLNQWLIIMIIQSRNYSDLIVLPIKM